MWQRIIDFKLPVLGWPITIYSFGTLIVVAFLVASWWVRRRAEKDLSLDRDRTFNVCFAVLFLGLLGARMLYALGHYTDFTKRPMSFLFIWEGGLVWYGGLVTGLLWLAWYVPRHADLKGFALLDILARGSCIALFLGWFACLAAGDQFGKVTTVPWGIPVGAYQDGTAAKQYAVDVSAREGSLLPTLKLHPTQIYESLFALALFLGLAVYAKKKPHPGRILALFLMVHAVGRAVIEVFRADDKQRSMVVEGVLSMTQLLCVPLFFAGVCLWLIRKPAQPHHHGGHG